MTKTHAAVGIVWHDGKVLVQQRQKPKIYSGYWEFPGGKIHPQETPAQALCRELQEELGIIITAPQPWLQRRHYYSHGEIALNFFHVRNFYGAVHGAEGQRWQWLPLTNPPSPLLPANMLIWKWLSLPLVYAVTAAEILGVDIMLQRLEKALQNGLKLVQLRDKNLPLEERRRLATKAATLCRAHHARLLINDDENLARATQADGVHLSAKQLAICERRPDFLWVAASCHSKAEVIKAAALELDFVVLSPVNKTLTHVNTPPLSWGKFAPIATAAGFPVYALGGMTSADIAIAIQHGAQGIGMMRQAWETP